MNKNNKIKAIKYFNKTLDKQIIKEDLSKLDEAILDDRLNNYINYIVDNHILEL